MDGAGIGRVLGLIETAGNQHYVFDTNRLRDAVGASCLIDQVRHVASHKAHSRRGEEILVASGKAEFLFPDAGCARDWIRDVTEHFAEEAPGMDLAGVWVDVGPALDKARRVAYQKLEHVRGYRAGPSMRHRTLPWVSPCHYSGEPAVDERNPVAAEHDEGRRVSDAVLKRRVVFEHAKARMSEALTNHGWSHSLIQQIDDAIAELRDSEACPEPLASEKTWRGVIHADANGLGRIFLHFGEIADTLGVSSEETYRLRLAELSRGIEEATWNALRRALEGLLKNLSAERVPVFPLIVGGDDVTLVTDGRVALYVAASYLRYFEEETANNDFLRSVAGKATSVFGSGGGERGFHACAGVAVVKHHFPFSTAYRLADELCTNAKKHIRTQPGSAVDWHIVLDSSPPSLEVIRERLRASDGVRLTRKPYRLDGLEDLATAAGVLTRRDNDGNLLLSGAAMHGLREGLVAGKEVAEAHLDALKAQLATRPQAAAALEKLLAIVGDGTHLVSDEATAFMDALDSRRFLRGWQS